MFVFSIKCQLSEIEREEIGRKCKHLIDYGRVKFLEEHGLTSSLKVYIEDFYTPENVVLLASLKWLPGSYFMYIDNKT